MKKRIYFILLLLLSFSSNIWCQADILTVVPKPKSSTFINERFSLDDSLITIKYSFNDTSNISIPLNEIKKTFKQVKGFNIHPGKNNSKQIWFGLPKEDKKFKKLCEENEIWSVDNISEKIGKQGYSLIIKKDLILIAANTKVGAYYGVQTLKQLLRGNRFKQFLPGLKIVDWPDLKYRGILDDISRGPVPTMEYMKYQIRRLAELKMNTLQYYTENVVLTKSHPEFAPPNGSISIEEFKELSEYAKKYHIMLIGNFQSFGHFEKILANPKYSHLGERGNILSPAFPESIQLLNDIYSEMVPAFNSPFFNINADETFDLGKGASKQLVDSLGIAIVYTNQIKKMHDILQSLNVRTMMWTDILLKYPESIAMLPKDIVLMTWGYDVQDSYSNMIEPFKDAGFDFTISPGVLNSRSVMPDYNVSIPNIHNFVKDGVKYGSMGMVCTVWDDGGSAFFSRDWYGVSYSADQSWNSTEYNISEFDKRFNNGIYGDSTESLTKSIWKLSSLASLPPTGGMKEKLLWMKVIPDSTEQVSFGLDDLDKIIEKIDSAENILNINTAHSYKDDFKYFQLVVKQYRYFANLRMNLLECARLYNEAFKFQNDNKILARNNFVEIIKILSETRELGNNLSDDFSYLWLKENKTHFLDSILVKYKNQLIALNDINQKVYSALNSLDSRLQIPPASSVRLNIKKGEGKYFTEWMMINPISIESPDSFNVDYLKAMGGELNAIPKVTQEFQYDNRIYRWRRTTSDYFDMVNLSEEFHDENKNVITYAFANIDSPDDGTVEASIRITGKVEVLINGKSVYNSEQESSLKVDENQFSLPLKKGRNNLMLKLYNKNGDWNFSFKLPNRKITNSKNRYKIEE